MTMKTTASTFAVGLLLAGTAATADAFDVVAAKSRIDDVLAKDYPHLEALYQDIHSHPELGFQEVRTSALLAKEMRDLGFE